MITENELRISNESYTHKDFYQIYPEILDLVNKITERWDPSSSNESDPGVVLLKLLAFIADKLNYNLDKNILECFMPSATQEDSMRKLCEMMGYDMKYYQSAEADVSFMWVGDKLPELPQADTYILLDRFTELQDDSGEVNFILTEPVTLTYKGQTETKKALEGTLQQFEINDDNLVKLYNLDDNRRLYLPESQIAENGIFISNIPNNESKEVRWNKVTNLNTQQPLTPVWKFGFDSKRRLPYIIFPEDVSELIGNGLSIKYIRTSGATGNVSAKTITKLTKLENVKLYTNGQVEEVPIQEDENVYLNIQNSASTSNGADFETLDQAYNSFKKTIGTFDTLVTCRDYANKIYQLVNTNNNPVVSNIQVTDIKDDINLASKIVSFDEFGIFYSDIPFKNLSVYKKSSLSEVIEGEKNYQGLNKLFYVNNEYYKIVYIGSGTPGPEDTPTDYEIIKVSNESVNRINHFDLYIYPLLDINNFYTAENYNNSFKPHYYCLEEIINQLQDYKTLSHNIKQLDHASKQDIYAIKNYYHLNAKISTTYKVTEYEASQILNNIYYSLWNRFNARKLDYGEEIPYDEILKCIETADSRIKVVSLEEPELKTTVMLPDSSEYTILNYDGNVSSETTGANIFYNLISKNVLAGKLPLFKYDNRFDYTIGELSAYNDKICGKECTYPYTGTTTKPVIPTGSGSEYSITAISTELSIPLTRVNSNTYTLKQNENIHMICPSLKTVKDGLYAAYVNYFFHSPGLTNQELKPCKLTKIKSVNKDDNFIDYYLITFDEFRETYTPATTEELRQKITDLARSDKYVWKLTAGKYVICSRDATKEEGVTYYITKNLNETNWFTFLNKFNNPENASVFYINNSNITNIPGYLIDINHNSYKRIQSYSSTLFTNKNLFVCLTSSQKAYYKSLSGIPYQDETTDNVGQTAAGQYIEANTEYKLKNVGDDSDKLYINYTDSNDVVHNITYWKEGNKYYKRDDINGLNTGLKVEFSGIIKANFDLYDSTVQAVTGYGKAYSKKSGYVWNDNDVPGMFSLDGQNQIEIRDFVKTEIKQSPFYCYWSVLGNTRDLILTKIQKSNNNKYIYEYILNDDEYFFYTDTLKNSLVTLSSGTSLKIHSSIDRGNKIILNLEDSTVSLNEISSNGIGAFSDTKWVTLKLNEDYFIEINENQIITLSQNDTLSGVQGLSDPYNMTSDPKTKIDNDWAIISNPSSVKYNNTHLPKFDFEESNLINWKIRSNLNLNMDETEGQIIEKDTQTSDKVVQKIDLYTSFYKSIPISTAHSPVYEDYDPTKTQEEEISSNTLLASFSSDETSKNFRLKSNYALNQPGGKYISMHRYTVEKTQKDDLYIYAYEKEPITAYQDNSSEGEPLNNISMYADSYYKLSFREAQAYKLPIFIPNNHMGLIMIYYSPSNNITNFAKASLVDDSNNLIDNSIALYRDSYEGIITTSEITLNKGINVLRIAKSGCLKITKQNQLGNVQDLGTILISDIDIIDISNNNVTGLNYSLLNIDKANCNSFVRDYIIAADLDNLFYYNAPIDKYNELDVNTMDQYSWFNYNNICNKFVIAELDSDFSDIKIAKSSRISKW